ncbi:5-hydroxytryptamine receptor [Cephus cinctus]|uniref:5-hydroxytryptamine receptor n=1 Tax=Cephus cinctus TaxID=211228 RepID=A0AAJ7RS38_CEPCN|nr:5-hydroxytryptamine receptor [Cephus cinctus]XP_015605163.1 5-hydroxytryptamine receptor [Cephus cinctus]XP_024945557.1 5-hydroxytryptamine receptor [Cephus cinctus]XP_024945558.1 5-hydroxytryptamine receptor [Cephus cinctus]XP_024945559.1 5-hydroxytryptamine receptor [Cephus cinctus]XP_024945560.1 5-hydroxytryptamine receptor [Cephus cinctus]XP_024945561.1 5-hydroxytryptamine receptor [Cephus cinctus]
MGGERLWWTWGMAVRGTAPNSSLPITSLGSNWNGTAEQEAAINRTENSTWNPSSPIHPGSEHDLVVMIVIATILSLLILITIVGNVFVIAAILLERNLQSVANYLILSLAVADLLVACLVMPLGAVYEVTHEWALGPELCDMWTSSDVLCCTASILHLVAIALDRYWAVTNIDYIHHRTGRRIGLMIAVVWLVAFLVCIAPLLGWKDQHWEMRVIQEKFCLVSQDVGYQIFATISSFYLPLFVILILYWRIYQTARKRIRRRVGQPANAPQGTMKTMGGAPPRPIGSSHAVGGALAQAQTSGGIAAAVVAVIGRPLPTISETTTAFTTVSSTNTSPEKMSYHNGLEADPPTSEASLRPPVSRRKKIAADSKRERKAAKTLAIITGAFVVCWLPFFVIAILLPVCKTCHISNYFVAFFQWLGYFNSTLNPAIYTVFSPEFRNAFKKLLCRRRRSVGRRMGVRHYM